jgi:ABC-2 type transport system permease protein
MINLRASLAVARWEFRRFVKPKQLFWALLLSVLAGGAGYLMSWLAERNSRATATIAVVDTSGLRPDAVPIEDGLTLTPRRADELDELRRQVTAGTLNGVLIITAPDTAELIVRRDPVWRAALEARVSAAARGRRLARAGIAPEQLQAMLAPVRTHVTVVGPGSGRAARVLAVIIVVGIIYGVFMAAAYIFVSITGEKQLRVTEQVMSAIEPQAWIDGKIVGIAGVAAVNVATAGLGVALFLAGRALASRRWDLAVTGVGAGDVTAMILFGVLGFLMWLAFLGAIAATVDDPNTSTRGPLLFLPAMCSLAALAIVRNPDSILARVLGLLPLTSASVMPARLALTSVPVWELLVSLLLLAATVWLLRGVAGRIFAVAMMLYGKEPSWAEMRRWMKEPV